MVIKQHLVVQTQSQDKVQVLLQHQTQVIQLQQTAVFVSGYSNPELAFDSGDIIYVEERSPITRASGSNGKH